MIEPVARLRIELQEIEPAIWRRLDVPLSSTLLALHDYVQFAFGWTDSHLFEFEIGGRRYGQPEYDRFADEKLYKAASIRLKTILDRGIGQFVYVYDSGDEWRHDIAIEEVRDGEPDIDYPAFVGTALGPSPEHRCTKECRTVHRSHPAYRTSRRGQVKGLVGEGAPERLQCFLPRRYLFTLTPPC